MATQPVEAAVGVGEPHAKRRYCHEVAGPTLVHATLIEVGETAVAVTACGLGQGGAGAFS